MIGCSDTIGPADLHVPTEVDQTTLTAGDSTHVRVTVTNISPRTVAIAASACMDWFRIYDRSGRDVTLDPRCQPDALVLELKFGQSHTFDHVWWPNLSPGSYVIRGYSLTKRGKIEGGRVEIQIN